VTKEFPGGTVAVDALDLEIPDGELMVLVGPSGCGKSTALRMIAGLEGPTSGTIMIGDRDMAGLSPGARDVAMVFQSYALYPHMTVRDNLAFPLRRRRMAKAEIGRRVAAMA
jgi:ABC-type sugar transport system ATPase subunit